MMIHYSPCKSGQDTQIQVVDDNTITIDGEEFIFDADSVIWEGLSAATNGKILEAHRENGTLFVRVLRFYSDTCPWDTGTFQEVLP